MTTISNNKQQRLKNAQRVFEFFEFPEGFYFSHSLDWIEVCEETFYLPLFMWFKDDELCGNFSIYFDNNGYVTKVNITDRQKTIASYGKSQINNVNKNLISIYALAKKTKEVNLPY